MKKTVESTDPDIEGSFPALRRAAKAAHKLAKETGTPLYIWEKGRVVNLNPVRRKRATTRRRLVD
jgi:hypothetical protein